MHVAQSWGQVFFVVEKVNFVVFSAAVAAFSESALDDWMRKQAVQFWNVLLNALEFDQKKNEKRPIVYITELAVLTVDISQESRWCKIGLE